MQNDDKVAAASLIAAVASVVIAGVAIIVSVYAIYKSNRNSSVATLVALNQGLHEGWIAFLTSKDDIERFFNLSGLVNLLEIACGIQLERSLSGMSRTMMKHYLDETLALLIENSYTNQEIAKMLNAPTTFGNIKRFINSKPDYLSVTVPPHWFQQR